MRFRWVILCCFSFIFIWGCKKDADNVTNITNNSSSVGLTSGTISGVMKDKWTGTPISGAVLSLAYNGSVHSVTSDASGGFSFADVPIATTSITDTPYVASNKYLITASLVSVNKTITDSTKRYRNYYYDTVQVSYTSINNSSAGVTGLVGTVVLEVAQLTSTITGTVVDANYQPVPNAIVYLYDESITIGSIIAQMTTSSAGTYTFSNVDNGIKVNIAAVSSNGKLRGSLSTFYSLSSERTSYILNANTSAEVIKLATSNNVAPYVYQISPENNADVAVGSSIIYTFTAPIKQTSYTRTDLGLGYSTLMDDIVLTYNGLKKEAGSISFTAAWNSSYTTLSITPTSVVGSAKYSINIATVLGKLTDSSALSVVNNSALTGDFETLSFTTAGNSTVPGAPVLTRRMITGVYSALDYTGGVVGLEWSSDANARSYNIYRSVNGGAFELYRSDVYKVQDTVSTGMLVYPLNTTNPLYAVTVRYKVAAVSKDLVEGSASNIIAVTDSVLPSIVSATSTMTTTKLVNIYFSEPLNQSSAETASYYSMKDTAAIPVTFTVAQASYLGYTSGSYRVQLSITASSAVIPTHYFLTVGQGVKDLAGNAVDTTSSKNKYTF